MLEQIGSGLRLESFSLTLQNTRRMFASYMGNVSICCDRTIGITASSTSDYLHLDAQQLLRNLRAHGEKLYQAEGLDGLGVANVQMLEEDMQQLYDNRCVFHNQSATVIKF